ncbi:hypothetical protein IWW45_007988, partial [Coemansia sp. RSA 485]
KGSKKAPKNRPGQQARRMMNAKIYGDDANHIKAAKKDKHKKEKREKNSDKASSAQAGSVHPSWEAKRRQKEILDKAKDVKGQKIVFE